MNAALTVRTYVDGTLPALISQAAATLAAATSAGEVLDAMYKADAVYVAAKTTARIQQAQEAHDEVVAATYRVQGDALVIQGRAKQRLADEYDAAQQRGEVGQSGSRSDLVPNGNEVTPTASDIGLSRKAIHQARLIRDAEVIDPGIVERTVNDILTAGGEPTKTAIRKAVVDVVGQKNGSGPKFKSREAVAARVARIRELAESGATSGQIAADVGLSEESVKANVKQHGIDVPADRIVGGTHRHDANRIVSHIVMDAENLTSDTRLINFSDLDPASVPAWIESLTKSRKALTQFIGRLEREIGR